MVPFSGSVINKDEKTELGVFLFWVGFMGELVGVWVFCFLVVWVFCIILFCFVKRMLAEELIRQELKTNEVFCCGKCPTYYHYPTPSHQSCKQIT